MNTGFLLYSIYSLIFLNTKGYYVPFCLFLIIFAAKEIIDMVTAEGIKELCKSRENANIEYKLCANEVSASVYETVCAFLNHSGGEIIIGVSDEGEIKGVNEKTASTMVKNIINTVNNPELFTPAANVVPQVIEVDGKSLIYVNVPVSPLVHQYKKHFYDRNGDADNDITQQPGLLAEVFERKIPFSSESRVIPFLRVEDLDKKTFDTCRQLVANTNPTHTWTKFSNEEILRSARLIGIDARTGKEGIRLAGLLLFGTDESLLDFHPTNRVEAIYRNKSFADYTKNEITDVTRYEDRLTERGNLIKAYYSLSDFVFKHLPDKFYLEEGNPQRLDLRSLLFREIIANLIVHREYSNPTPGTLEIFIDRVITSNWSKFIIGEKNGKMSIDELRTYPKNPLIVNVFRQFGWVEELGSGFRNIRKYAPLYYKNCQIEIDTTKLFVLSITYQDSKEALTSVKSVNLDKPSVKSVKIDDSIVKLIIDEKLEVSPKSKDRLIREFIHIVNERRTTKEALQEKLNLTPEQVKTDLRVLAQRRMIDFDKGTREYYPSPSILERLEEMDLKIKE